MKKIVIVGGVAGGASAAARARRLCEQAQIIMFERGEHVSFANCGLPYYIGGQIKQESALLLQTPASFKSRFNIDVRVKQDVIGIDTKNKFVTVRDLLSGTEYQESYDKLLLSPGASPIIPALPGINNPLTFALRNIADMQHIIQALDTHKPEHATVCGGGYIGLEMTEALRARGVNVTLVELAAQVMAPIDVEMAAYLHQEIVNHGVDLRLNQGLEKVELHTSTEGKSSLTLQLSSGQQLSTGLLIMAIGVRPEVSLASKGGLKIGSRGGIVVDRYMQTSHTDIYAVGDAVEVVDFVSQDKTLIPLAGPASRQGRNAADNMFGRQVEYKQSQGTGICKVFDLTAANVGLNEKMLQRKNMAYQKIYVHAADHASYYPGAEMIHLKLLFSPTNGAILGAQAVGKAGIDKRIDILAVAQRAKMSVFDLQDLELCYAPPYGSAKDVVNLAGFVASNVLKGDLQIIHYDQIERLSDQQMLIDVRNPPELNKLGTVPGAKNIPLDQLRQRINELPKDKEIIVLCQIGLRGNIAYRQLINRGYQVKNVSGGFATWSAAKSSAGKH